MLAASQNQLQGVLGFWGFGVLYVGNVKDGLPNSEGILVSYRGGYKVLECKNWVRGKLNGIVKKYYQNDFGSVKSISEYKDDRKNGFGKNYGKNGKLLRQAFYFLNDENVTIKKIINNGV